jgi:hypothetical protein
MEVEWSHITKKRQKCYKATSRLESTRSAKKRKAQKHLAKRSKYRATKIGMTWNETKTMAKDRRGWKANLCNRPMSTYGRSGLSQVSHTKNGDFPEKPHWKCIVVNVVNQKQDNEWQTRINLDNDFNRFREIHFSVSIPSVWTFTTNCSELRTAKFFAKLISSVPNSNGQSCEINKRVCKDIFIHESLSCPKYIRNV